MPWDSQHNCFRGGSHKQVHRGASKILKAADRRNGDLILPDIPPRASRHSIREALRKITEDWGLVIPNARRFIGK